MFRKDIGRLINKIMAILLISMLLVGCNINQDELTGVEEDAGLKIVTTLFPQYDFTRQIAGERVEVSLILPPGVEPHSFDPTPQDIINIRKADLFIYTGEHMEPWAERIIESLSGYDVLVVDVSKGIQLVDEDEYDHEDECEDYDHVEKDPHIWLDPILAQKMVDNILVGLIETDHDNEDFYRENAENYKKKLHALHEKFEEMFSKAQNNTIMYGGHFAFGYFAQRYGLKHVSPYRGFAPDAEPTPQRISEMIRNIRGAGMKYIYYEELVEPRVARVIAEEAGAEMLLLHGAHNISRKELEEGISYIQIMEENLERLKLGLGYNE